MTHPHRKRTLLLMEKRFERLGPASPRLERMVGAQHEAARSPASSHGGGERSTVFPARFAMKDVMGGHPSKPWYGHRLFSCFFLQLADLYPSTYPAFRCRECLRPAENDVLPQAQHKMYQKNESTRYRSYVNDLWAASAKPPNFISTSSVNAG